MSASSGFGGLGSLFGGGSQPGVKLKLPKANPSDRFTADVANRRGQSQKDIISDFVATLKSANYGNQGDKYKLQAYQHFFPQYFDNPISKSIIDMGVNSDKFKKGALTDPNKRFNWMASQLTRQGVPF